MNRNRKSSFWDRFVLNQENASAYFRRNSGGSNLVSFDETYDSDKDSEYNVVFTPVPDYEATSGSWTYGRRQKQNTRKVRGHGEKRTVTDDARATRRSTHNPRERTRSAKLCISESDSSSQSSERNTYSEKHDKNKRTKNYKRENTRRENVTESSDERRPRKKKVSRQSSADSLTKTQKQTKRRYDRESTLGSKKSSWKHRHDTTSSSSSEEDIQRADKISKSNANKLKKKLKDTKRSSESDASSNWSLKRKEKQNDGLMLRITMEDLKSVINENVMSAVKHSIETDKTRYGRLSPEILTTDTETMNSGLSYSSNTSTEGLLTGKHQNQRRFPSGSSAAYRHIPATRHGSLLKRFVPFPTNSETNTKSSQQNVAMTLNSLSGSFSSASDPYEDHKKSQRSSAPEQLLSQSGILKGTLPDRSMSHGNSEMSEEIFFRQLDERIAQKVAAASKINETQSEQSTSAQYDPLGVTTFEEPLHYKKVVKQASFEKERNIHFEDQQNAKWTEFLNGRKHSSSSDFLVEGHTNMNQFNRRATIAFDEFPSNISNRRGSFHIDDQSEIVTNKNLIPHARTSSVCMENRPMFPTVLSHGPTMCNRRESPIQTNANPMTMGSDFVSIGNILGQANLMALAGLKDAALANRLNSNLPAVIEEGSESKDENAAQTYTGLPLPIPTTEMLRRIKESNKRKRQFRSAKIMVLLSSILAAMAGVGLLGIGVLSLVDEDAELYTSVTKKGPADNMFQYYCYALCTAGISTGLIWFFGCLGAIKANCCLLKTFIVCLLVLLILDATLILVVIVSGDQASSIPMLTAIVSDVEGHVLKQMMTSVREKYIKGSIVMKAWDRLQVQEECCGTESKDDFKTSAWKNSTVDKKTNLPDSCCVVAVKDPLDIQPTNRLLCQALTTGFSHKEGCFSVVIAWYKQSSTMVLAAMFSLIFLEIVCILFAVRLCKGLQKQRKKDETKKKEQFNKDKEKKTEKDKK